MRRAKASGTSCEGEKKNKNRGSKPGRKDCRRKDWEERGKGGGRWRPTHSLTVAAKPQSAASRPFPLLSHCVHLTIPFIDAWLFCSRLRTMHDCSAHGQLVLIASNPNRLMNKIYLAFTASSPRGRWRCAYARQRFEIPRLTTWPRARRRTWYTKDDFACSRIKSPGKID